MKASATSRFALLLLVPESRTASSSCANCSPAPGGQPGARPRRDQEGLVARARRRRPARALRRAAGDVGSALLQDNATQAERLAAEWAQAVPAALLHRTAARRRRLAAETCMSARARARRPAGAAGGRDPPGAVPQARGISRARSARVHRRGLCARRPAPAARIHAAEQYFKTQAEMAELFADIPEALANSVEIARALQPDAGARQEQAAAVPDPGGSEPGRLSARPGAQGPGSCACASSSPTQHERAARAPSTARGSSSRSRPSPRWASPATS